MCASPDAARDRVRRRRRCSTPRTAGGCAPPASSCGCGRRPRCSRRASATARDRPLLAGDPVGALDRLGAAREAAYEAGRDAVVDTDGRDVDAVADAVLRRVRRSTPVIERVRVDLGARGYDVVVGAGALAELATLLARPPPRRGRQPGRDRRRHTSARVARRARRAPASTHDDVPHGRRRGREDARDRRRPVPRASRSGACCAATRSSRSAAASSATPPASRRRSTTAASTSCRCRPRCSRWSTPRSAARPREPARGQEPRRRVPPAARRARRPRRARDAARRASTAAGSARSRSTRCSATTELAALARATRRRAARPRPGVLTERRSPRCAAIKAARRRRRRARAHRACAPTLNLGHTLAHALETARRLRARCTARRSRSGSCSPAHLARALERIDRRARSTRTEQLRAPRSACRPRRRRACAPTTLLAVMRARQEVGRRAHVRAARAATASRRVDDPDPRRARRTRSPRSAWEADRRWRTILLLSGPNLNLLGEREPEHLRHRPRSTTSSRSRRETAAEARPRRSSTCSRTTRATLIDAIHGARGRCAAIVINAGAFTHYVVRARRRARDVRRREGRAAPLEPDAREDVAPRLGDRARRRRHRSPGFGAAGYRLAVEAAARTAGGAQR